MKNVCAAVVLVFALQFCAPPVSAVVKKCGNGKIDPLEQCEVPASQPSSLDAACPGMCIAATCKCPTVTTVNLTTTKAKPADTPGTKGVKAKDVYPQLVPQFGTRFSLNKARYTRFKIDNKTTKPDAVLILIPGFEGGAANFRILAQNLVKHFNQDHCTTNTDCKRLEVWAFDRRTNQLEDTAGLDVAENRLDPMLGINWLFGTELGLTPSLLLPRRPVDTIATHRARFYNPQNDVPFMANWTNLVFSQDIDAVVNAARVRAKNHSVFLGGHSAGTGFTARYASTDFNIWRKTDGTLQCNTVTKTHKPQPGYAKLRGLVLLEGMGGSTAGGDEITDDSLDRMIAKADGGLFNAVNENVGTCADHSTPCTVATQKTDCGGTCTLNDASSGKFGRCVDDTKCTIATEATDCATAVDPVTGALNPKCTLPTTAYALVSVAGLPVVNPRVAAQGEALAIQGITDPNIGPGITAASGAGNNVPDLAGLSFAVSSPATVEGGFGTFLDKDGLTAALSPFLAMSLGEPGALTGVCGTVSGAFTPPTACTFANESTACAAFSPATCMGMCADQETKCTQATQAADCHGQSPATCLLSTTWSDMLQPGLTLNHNLGAAPTTLTARPPAWGNDAEVTRMDRVLWAFFAGKTNFTDWYYPNAGPSTTSVSGVCSGNPGTCLVGNLGEACSGTCSGGTCVGSFGTACTSDAQCADADCSQAINLDSSLLSLPDGDPDCPATPPSKCRNRCDIENLTQAGNINIPVIAFSASQGLATVPGVYTAFAQSITLCDHTLFPSCDGTTSRVPDPNNPNPAWPTFGDVAGGFEVYVNEGYSHLDVCTAEDNSDHGGQNIHNYGGNSDYCCSNDNPSCSATKPCNNNVVGPISDFIYRNMVPPTTP